MNISDGAGLPALRRADRGASSPPRTASTSARGSRVMVTAGANMAFMHAVLATTARATRSSCRCRSTSITRWPSRWPAAAPCACRPTTAISCGSTRSSAPSRLAPARSSRSRRTTRAARSSAKPLCARSTTLCRERGHLSLLRRALRVLHLRRRAPRLAGLVRRMRAGHTIVAVFAVEGVRVCRLAHRLRGVSRASRRRR